MSRALITGGGGFIGLHLARRLLRDGHQIELVDNFSRGARDSDFEQIAHSDGVRVHDLDLLAPRSIEALGSNVDLIYHLAAIVGVANVMQRPFDVLTHNYQLLLNTLALARQQQNLQRFVFASTSEVYAGTLKHFGMEIPTPETTPIALHDVSDARGSYMLSKIHGEALCQHSSLPFTIIRPHNVYGPRMGMAHVIPELLKKAHDATDGGTLDVYSVDHTRTFCYVEDAVELITAISLSPDCTNRTFNIGNESPEISILELAKVVVDVVGRDLTIAPQPATAGSPTRRAPAMSKAIEQTRHQSRFDLRRGIGATYDWYRTNHFDAPVPGPSPKPPSP